MSSFWRVVCAGFVGADVTSCWSLVAASRPKQLGASFEHANRRGTAASFWSFVAEHLRQHVAGFRIMHGLAGIVQHGGQLPHGPCS